MDGLRSGARRMRWWTTLLILFVAAVMVLEIAARAGAFGAADPAYRLGLDLLFTPELATAMRHVGLLLTAGAAAAFVINPYLHRLAALAYPRLVEFDVATLVIAAVGIALTFIARLFDQAVRLQREMDEIF